jgi:hypothetical protein
MRPSCCVRADAPQRPRGRIFTVSADCKTRLRVKPRPRDKCGRGRTSRQCPWMSELRGRPDGNFHPKTSVMTSLLLICIACLFISFFTC